MVLSQTQGCVSACRACPERDLDYEASRLKKQNRLESLFSDFEAPVRWHTDVYPKTHYRRSVSLRVAWVDGAWHAGTVDRDQNLTPIPKCPVHEMRVNLVLQDLCEQMQTLHDAPWFAVAIQGSFLSLGFKTKEQSAWVRRLNETIEWNSLLLRHRLDGVYVQCDPSMGNRRWSSKGWSTLGLVRAMSPMPLGLGLEAHLMFSQQRLDLWKQCLNSAMDFLSTPEPYQFLDLYCGNGVARSFLKIEPVRSLGVELSGASISAAKHWAIAQNWKQVEFLRGRVKDRIPQIVEWINQGNSRGLKTRMYVNPSRLGVEIEAIDQLKQEWGPDRIAYLSCNPKTLKRDLSLLQECGLSAESITGYDFFPYTRQVEALAFLRNLQS